jgi:VanZ family protein
MLRGALIAWLAAVAFVVAMSLRPEPEMPMPFDEADKLYHFAGYAVLAFLPFLAFRGWAALCAASSMIVLGAALELGQSFVPGRSASLADIAANTAGVLLGIVWPRYWPRRFASREPAGTGRDDYPDFALFVLEMIVRAGTTPVAAAETMLPATPGPSPETKRLPTAVSSSGLVWICMAKNLISGA